MDKKTLIGKLRAFINTRPGFDLQNYASMSDYRQDYNRSLRDKHDAERLLIYIDWHDESITVDKLLEKLNGNDRLTLNEKGELEYCTGQYYPTEYRGAVVRLCRGVIRDFLWKDSEPFRESVYREFDKRFANRVFF